MHWLWVASITVLWLSVAVTPLIAKKYEPKTTPSLQYKAKKDTIQDSLADFVAKNGIMSNDRDTANQRAEGILLQEPVTLTKPMINADELFTPEVISVLQQMDKEKKNIMLPNGDTLTFGPALTGDFTDITNILSVVLATLAAIAAGFASLIAFIVPPLQIANQILAIIAIALLIAYISEDKGFMEYMVETTGYDDSGYGGYDSGNSGYGDFSNFMSYGGVGSGSSGYSASNSGGGGVGSSYTDYRRTGLDQSPFDGFSNPAGVVNAATSINNIGARSMAPRSVINRLARMVGTAVNKYSTLYGDEHDKKA